MELTKNQKIFGGAAIGLALILIVVFATKKKGPAEGDTGKGGSGAKGDGSNGGGGKSGGNNTAQDIAALGGAAAAVGGAITPGSSTTTTSVSTTNLPPAATGVVQIDMTGTWQSTQNSGYSPQCNSSMLSFNSNNSFDAPYETTGAGTITFMNNPNLVADSPNGAVVGTIGGSGTNSDGSTNIGTTIQWNDANGDMWTRIS